MRDSHQAEIDRQDRELASKIARSRVEAYERQVARQNAVRRAAGIPQISILRIAKPDRIQMDGSTYASLRCNLEGGDYEPNPGKVPEGEYTIVRETRDLLTITPTDGESANKLFYYVGR
jgi:hypothetical protein